jgi:hypothetical protein
MNLESSWTLGDVLGDSLGLGIEKWVDPSTPDILE